VTAGLITEEAPLLYGSATATFDSARVYRYQLTRIWDELRPSAVWIMLNPSTADAEADDPTIRRCAGFTKAWGLGGLVVVNLFALRATDPRLLRRHPDPVGPRNDEFITEIVWPDSLVVCAWGANRVADERSVDVLGILSARGAQPKCLGKTRDGYPRHPLYVRGSTELGPFEPESEAA
jgi:hypothetical protein